MTEQDTYAIIATGGKQFRVQTGDVVDVELLDVEKNGAVEFQEVLFFSGEGKTVIGSPHVEKAVVRGEVLAEARGPKVIAYKYKKRKNYRRKVGHRQRYTRVKITELAV